MSNSEQVFWMLLRLALGCRRGETKPDDVDWREVYELACGQGVVAMALDGLYLLIHEDAAIAEQWASPELECLRLEWMGRQLCVEQAYSEHKAALQHLYAYYRSQGLPTMLLKGYGVSKEWPISNHRSAGDIDIYQFGRWKEGDLGIRKHLNVEVDNGHHHHSVFVFEGQMVENHYDFLNVHSHRSTRWIEQKLKDLAAVSASESKVPILPSADFNVVFLARHAAAHFAAEGLSVKQVLDWALYVKNHHVEADWKMAWDFYTKAGMLQFVLCMIEIAVGYLGMDREWFHIPDEYSGRMPLELKEKVVADMLRQDKTELPSGLIRYWRNRMELWWRNRWKHKMVYSDSLFSTFCFQAVSHIRKPKTLIGK